MRDNNLYEFEGRIRKPRRVKCVMFNGLGNSVPVAKWLKKHGIRAIARGRYVEVWKFESFKIVMTKGDFAVLDIGSGEVGIYDEQQFHEEIDIIS